MMTKVTHVLAFIVALFVGSANAIAAQKDSQIAVEDALVGFYLGMRMHDAKALLPGSVCETQDGLEYCEKAVTDKRSWLGNTNTIFFAGTTLVKSVIVNYPTDAELLTELVSHLRILYGEPKKNKVTIGSARITNWRWHTPATNCSIDQFEGINLVG